MTGRKIFVNLNNDKLGENYKFDACRAVFQIKQFLQVIGKLNLTIFPKIANQISCLLMLQQNFCNFACKS